LEDLKTFLTNFDFEVRLGKSTFEKPQYSKYSKSFESLFLWCEKASHILYSEKAYDPFFLSDIEKKRGFSPSVSCEKPFTHMWWGAESSVQLWELEKTINSKETSYNCRKDLGLEVKGSELLFDKTDIGHLKVPFILKTFFGFSGKGISFIRSESEKEAISPKAFPLLAEPILQRVRDFGVFYEGDKKQIVQNLNDDKGQFKGVYLKEDFPEQELIFEKTAPVFKWYQKKFDIDSLQIDCFQYLDDGELKFNALCEVNHRRTMGNVATKIYHQFGNKSAVMAVVSKKKVRSFENHRAREIALAALNYQSRAGVLCLSQVEDDFQVFFIAEESDRSLQHLIMSWWKCLRGEEHFSLPREFIINS